MSALLLLLAAQVAADLREPIKVERTPPPVTVPPPPVVMPAAPPVVKSDAVGDNPFSGPVDPPVLVRPEDVRIAPSASVLAATLDYLRSPPATPRTVRLTCMVLKPAGIPVNCFPADAIGAPTTWAMFFQRSNAFLRQPAGASEADEDALDLMTAAMDRVYSTRLRPVPAASKDKSVRLMQFDVTISAADARPVAPLGKPLRLQDLVLEHAFDPDLVRDLYPAPALAQDAAARVSFNCLIEAGGSLLCRDRPGVESISGAPIARWLKRYFILSSYQAASTLKVGPKAVNGSDVVGRSVSLSIRWQMPTGIDSRSGGFVPSSVIRRWAMDIARQRQLKLPPVAPLPRADSLAILNRMLDLPGRALMQDGTLLEESIRSALAGKEGRPSAMETKYPGFTAAVTRAVLASITGSFETMNAETAAMIEKRLAALTDGQLAILAAAAQPLIALNASTTAGAAAKGLRPDFDRLLDSREARPMLDLNIRYMDLLETQPGGAAALAALEATIDAVADRLKTLQGGMSCRLLTAMKRATVDFLVSRGATADARLLGLRDKAEAAGNPCKP